MCRLCEVPVPDYKGLGKNRVPLKDQERFLKRIEKGEGGCWLWTGSLRGKGYAVFSWAGTIPGETQRRAVISAHRWAYEHFVGPIPEGMTIDHVCHDPQTCTEPCQHRRCVNPEHLAPVSNRDNVLRGGNTAAINARKTHCKRGHEFTEANTYFPPAGGRQCIACQKARTSAGREQANERRRQRRAAQRAMRTE